MSGEFWAIFGLIAIALLYLLRWGHQAWEQRCRHQWRVVKVWVDEWNNTYGILNPRTGIRMKKGCETTISKRCLICGKTKLESLEGSYTLKEIQEAELL